MTDNKRYYFLLMIGLIVLNADFILKRFIEIPDVYLGGLKGFGIGLLILSLILKSKNRSKKVSDKA